MKAHLCIDTRKAVKVITSTKISIILHFARESSQTRIVPRLDVDTIRVELNHKKSVTSCFVYGQIPEKMRIIMASPFPPAEENLLGFSWKNNKFYTVGSRNSPFHISIAEAAMENSKKSSETKDSPARLRTIVTDPPRER